VSEETSTRVCTHMNDDHAVSVYAMARRVAPLDPRFKISEARMKKVTLDGCQIQVVACRQDLCQVHSVVFPFDPRLKSGAELRPRLVAIHHRVCAPQPGWLVRKPVAVTVLAMMAFLTYCMVGLGPSQLRAFIEEDKGLDRIVTVLFGSPKVFGVLVRAAFYFGHTVHAAEAVYGMYRCRQTLKLKWSATVQWTFMIALTGYPVLGELQSLVAVANRKKKN
jgi:Protein of unknown function (DUF2470)/Domain of unknown function (DUF4499)